MSKNIESEYKAAFSKPLSKNFLDEIIARIEQNPSDFEIVYALIFDEKIKIAWRAAWAIEKISEKHPGWFSDRQISELTELSIKLNHDGLNRLCLSVLLNVKLQNPVSVEFINRCFDCIVSGKFAVAVQVLSMKLLYRICTIEPDLKNELKLTLENIDTSQLSAGYLSARKNILKKISNV